MTDPTEMHYPGDMRMTDAQNVEIWEGGQWVPYAEAAARIHNIQVDTPIRPAPDPRTDTVCYVDALAPGQWEVTVWNRAEPPDRRVYTLGASCDNSAAEQGMTRFVDEMEALGEMDS